MVKNSREGNRERAARRRAALAERGIKQILLMAPEQAHPLLKQAAVLMTRDDDPLEPHAALRRAGGANQPEPGEASPNLIAELDAVKAKLVETERQRQALAAERDAAIASEAEARKKVAAGARLVLEAQEKVIEADRKARLAWAPVRRIGTMRGFRGRLARWIADVRPEDPDG